MREVSTIELGSRSINVNPDRELTIGQHTMNFTSTTLSLVNGHVDQIGDHIRNGLVKFYERKDTPEPTLAREVTGLPTMVARLDCTLDHFGNIIPLEVEERPNGIAIADMLVKPEDNIGLIEPVREHYIRLIGRLPIVAFTACREDRIDDTEFMEGRLLNDSFDGEEPLLLRAEPEDLISVPEGVIRRSVSTARHEGLKNYRERTGHAKLVKSLDDIPGPDASFVLKGVQCSKAQRIAVYMSPTDREELGAKGVVSRNRVMMTAARLIGEDGAVIIEPLRRPIPAKIGDRNGHMILRIFATVTNSQRIDVVGGIHMTREELIVHGATNSVTGAVVLG